MRWVAAQIESELRNKRPEHLTSCRWQTSTPPLSALPAPRRHGSCAAGTTPPSRQRRRRRSGKRQRACAETIAARTEEFTVIGTDRPPVRFSTIFCPRFEPTDASVSSPVSIEVVVGIHGQPWPEVSRPVWPSGPVSSRALNRQRAEALATLPLGIDAGEIDGPVWSVSGRGTAGALDRVAQIPARPFRLGLTRVL